MPASESHHLPPNAVVNVTFDQAVSAGTVNPDALVFHSSTRGVVSSNGVYHAAGDTVTWDYNEPFLPGERIQASLTPEALGANGEPALPQVWQFRAATSGGTGYFDLGPEFASSGHGDFQFGDLDGDDDLDAVLVGVNLRTYFNDGHGQFTLRDNIPFQQQATALSLGDIDSDGDLDIFVSDVTTAMYGNELRGHTDGFWINDGGGNFAKSNAAISNGATNGSALGDLDGDGDLDVATVSTQSHDQRFTVWLNDGMNFTERRLSYVASDVTLSDLDLDGDLDMVAAGVNSSLQELASSAWINDGSAAFTNSQENFFGLALAVGVDTGDVNGDGIPDVLLADAAGEDNRIWFGDGQGRFTDSGARLGDTKARDGQLGDLDGDGDLDAIIFGWQESLVWLNDGAGNFTRARQTLIGTFANNGDLGDLDGDGDLDTWIIDFPNGYVLLNDPTPIDLAVSFSDQLAFVAPAQSLQYAITVTNHGPAAAHNVAVQSNLADWLTAVAWTSAGTAGTVSMPNGTGDVVDTVSIPAGGSITYTVTATVTDDVDVDAVDSWLTSSLRVTAEEGILEYDEVNDSASDTNRLVFPASGGTGGFRDSGQVMESVKDGNTELIDIDGDGDLDAFVAKANSSELWLNDAGHFISHGPVFNQEPTKSLAFFDWDGDGDLDVARVASAMEFWTNNGNLQFIRLNNETWSGGHGGFEAVAADFNGDAQWDVVTVSAQWIDVVINAGGGDFQDAIRFDRGDDDAIDATFGDFDQDGDVDIVVVNLQRPSEFWLNDGHGRFHESPHQFLMNYAQSVDSGDVDGDGDLDLFIGGYAVGTGVEALSADYVWINDGHGVFTDSGQRLGESGTNEVQLGDLDGDGDLDAVSTEYTFDQVATVGQLIYLNDGLGRFTRTGADWGAAATFDVDLGDVDGDGDLDALVLGDGVHVWLNDEDAVDLAVTLNEPSVLVTAGALLNYTLVVENRSQNLAENATVDLVAANDLTGLAWTSVTTGGATAAPSGMGEIHDVVTLPPGASITYTVSATASPQGAISSPRTLQVSGSATPALGALDYAPVNNGDADFNTVQVLAESTSAVFEPGSALEDGNYTGELALGDIDADGDLDAIVGVSAGALVLMNDGAGNYMRRTTLAAVGADDVQLADLDGDGDLDLLHVELTGGFVPRRTITWLNDGDGNFTDFGGGIIALGASEASLADLDGDGDVDMFLQHRQLTGIYLYMPQVYLNNGDGSFTSNGQYLFVDGRRVRLGDIDGDGDADAVTDGPRSFWLNDGHGYFLAMDTALQFDASTPFELGDLDADGDLDLFVGDDNFGTLKSVYFNDGAGRFTASGQTLPLAKATDVALGDLDGDGDLDAVSSPESEPGQTVWLNDGLGAFVESPYRIGSAFGQGLALGDLDADQDLDLFVNSSFDRAELWLNHNGPYSELKVEISNEPTISQAGDTLTYRVVVTNAGPTDLFDALVHVAFPAMLTDVVWASEVSPGATATAAGEGDIEDSVSLPAGGTIVYIATGTARLPDPLAPPLQFTVTASAAVPEGMFDAAPGNNLASDVNLLEPRSDHGYRNFVGGAAPPSDYASRGAATGDWDGDGDQDVIVTNQHQPTVMLRNDGQGNFAPFAGNLPSLAWLELGDLDGDGDLDAVAINGSNRLQAWLNNGQGVFQVATESALSGSAQRTVLGDLDGDGDLDVFIAAGFSDNTSVLLNDGHAQFNPLRQPFFIDSRRDAVLGDLNGDGSLDALLLTDQRFHVALNDGDGRFEYSSSPQLTNVAAVALGDLDRDGDLDAVFAGSANSQSVWVNDGQGVFTRRQTLTHAGGGTAVTLGDFDADGDLDAFVATSGNAPDQLWYNDGFGFLIRGQQSLGGGDGVDVALADFDGDGDLDTYVAQVGADALWLNHPANGDTFPFDGLVRVEDLNRVRNHFGASGPADGTLPGDTYPFDGDVGIEDLNAVRNHFGGATPLPSPAPSRQSRGATPLDKPVSAAVRSAAQVRVSSSASAFDVVFEMFAHENNSVPAAKRPRGARTA